MIVNNSIHINDQVFSLDLVFNEHASQKEIYNAVGNETIEEVLDGYNGTVFAYGPTGSGKTYT